VHLGLHVRAATVPLACAQVQGIPRALFTCTQWTGRPWFVYPGDTAMNPEDTLAERIACWLLRAELMVKDNHHVAGKDMCVGVFVYRCLSVQS
jgi:hypothetical protein